jgi:hypothetical protein
VGQLILPEPLKLMPLSTLGLIKHPLMSDGLPADERAFLFSLCASMTVQVSFFVLFRVQFDHARFRQSSLAFTTKHSLFNSITCSRFCVIPSIITCIYYQTLTLLFPFFSPSVFSYNNR